MELQLLAELANDIFGTGQVFSAGRNLTPLNGTALSGEKKGCGWARHAGATALVHACVCVLVYYYIWKDLLESRTLEENSKIYIKNEGVLRHQSRNTLTHLTWWTDKLHITFFVEIVIWFKSSCFSSLFVVCPKWRRQVFMLRDYVKSCLEENGNSCKFVSLNQTAQTTLMKLFI